MAEVFIAQTRPEIEDNTPRKPTDPIRMDQPQIFVPAPPPILNSDAAVIMGIERQQGPVYGAPAPVSIGSGDAVFTATFQPVSNQVGAGTIYGEGPTERRVNLPPPPSPIATNQEVTFTPGPAPISNSDTAINSSQSGPPLPPVERSLFPSHQGASISSPSHNENPAQFLPGLSNGAMYYDGDTFIPQPPTPGGPEPIKSDTLNVGGGDVQFLAGGAPLNVNGAVTFGGGGDTTKQAGTEDVSFLGMSAPVSIGGTEVFSAPSQNIDHTPGQSDIQFAPSADLVGNQEAITGAVGEPTANLDHGSPRIGEWGLGKPKNVKG